MKDISHIYAAKKVFGVLPREIQNSISRHIDLYYLGALFPDAFYYTRSEISLQLHGESYPASRFPLLLLDNLKKKDLPFLYGYLTHVEMDRVFHPIINELSSKHKGRELYYHYLYETLLEQKLGNRCYLDYKMVLQLPEVVVNLLQSEFHVSKRYVFYALKKQITYSRRFYSVLYYFICKLFMYLGITARDHSALFTTELLLHPVTLPSGFNITSMLTEGIHSSKSLILDCHDYANQKITRVQFEKLISQMPFS